MASPRNNNSSNVTRKLPPCPSTAPSLAPAESAAASAGATGGAADASVPSLESAPAATIDTGADAVLFFARKNFFPGKLTIDFPPSSTSCVLILCTPAEV
mmetsp:Transcript_2376/g.3738  ORF Transcript_2376/g.3738 Transcript_2376/m.3738 type:complete len:100 (-) Transcript_2376:702-1001(-)